MIPRAHSRLSSWSTFRILHEHSSILQKLLMIFILSVDSPLYRTPWSLYMQTFTHPSYRHTARGQTLVPVQHTRTQFGSPCWACSKVQHSYREEFLLFYKYILLQCFQWSAIILGAPTPWPPSTWKPLPFIFCSEFKEIERDGEITVFRSNPPLKNLEPDWPWWTEQPAAGGRPGHHSKQLHW